MENTENVQPGQAPPAPQAPTPEHKPKSKKKLLAIVGAVVVGIFAIGIVVSGGGSGSQFKGTFQDFDGNVKLGDTEETQDETVASVKKFAGWLQGFVGITFNTPYDQASPGQIVAGFEHDLSPEELESVEEVVLSFEANGLLDMGEEDIKALLVSDAAEDQGKKEDLKNGLQTLLSLEIIKTETELPSEETEQLQSEIDPWILGMAVQYLPEFVDFLTFVEQLEAAEEDMQTLYQNLVDLDSDTYIKLLWAAERIMDAYVEGEDSGAEHLGITGETYSNLVKAYDFLTNDVNPKYKLVKEDSAQITAEDMRANVYVQKMVHLMADQTFEQQFGKELAIENFSLDTLQNQKLFVLFKATYNFYQEGLDESILGVATSKILEHTSFEGEVINSAIQSLVTAGILEEYTVIEETDAYESLIEVMENLDLLPDEDVELKQEIVDVAERLSGSGFLDIFKGQNIEDGSFEEILKGLGIFIVGHSFEEANSIIEDIKLLIENGYKIAEIPMIGGVCETGLAAFLSSGVEGLATEDWSSKGIEIENNFISNPSGFLANYSDEDKWNLFKAGVFVLELQENFIGEEGLNSVGIVLKEISINILKELGVIEIEGFNFVYAEGVTNIEKLFIFLKELELLRGDKMSSPTEAEKVDVDLQAMGDKLAELNLFTTFEGEIAEEELMRETINYIFTLTYDNVKELVEQGVALAGKGYFEEALISGILGSKSLDTYDIDTILTDLYIPSSLKTTLYTLDESVDLKVGVNEANLVNNYLITSSNEWEFFKSALVIMSLELEENETFLEKLATMEANEALIYQLAYEVMKGLEVIDIKIYSLIYDAESTAVEKLLIFLDEFELLPMEVEDVQEALGEAALAVLQPHAEALDTLGLFTEFTGSINAGEELMVKAIKYVFGVSYENAVALATAAKGVADAGYIKSSLIDSLEDFLGAGNLTLDKFLEAGYINAASILNAISNVAELNVDLTSENLVSNYVDEYEKQWNLYKALLLISAVDPTVDTELFNQAYAIIEGLGLLAAALDCDYYDNAFSMIVDEMIAVEDGTLQVDEPGPDFTMEGEYNTLQAGLLELWAQYGAETLECTFETDYESYTTKTYMPICSGEAPYTVETCLCPAGTDSVLAEDGATFTCETEVVVLECTGAGPHTPLESCTCPTATPVVKIDAIDLTAFTCEAQVDSECTGAGPFDEASCTCPAATPVVTPDAVDATKFTCEAEPAQVVTCSDYPTMFAATELTIAITTTEIDYNAKQAILTSQIAAAEAANCAVLQKYKNLAAITWANSPNNSQNVNTTPVNCSTYTTEFANLKTLIQSSTPQAVADMHIATLNTKITQATSAGCYASITADILALQSYTVAQTECEMKLVDLVALADMMNNATTEAQYTTYKLTLFDKVSLAKVASCSVPIEIEVLLAQPFVIPVAQLPPPVEISSLLQANVLGETITEELYQVAPPQLTPQPVQVVQQQPAQQQQIQYVPAAAPQMSAEQMQAMGMMYPQQLGALPPGAVPYMGIPANTGPETYVYGLLALFAFGAFEYLRRKKALR
jgi:hypothetical protein